MNGLRSSSNERQGEDSDPGGKRGRAHDAEGARDAILDAGEEVFAQHGFDGARIDAIAGVAGYNKSLIFQYFEDKLGLYAAVIRRADDQTRGWQDDAFRTLGALGSHVSPHELRDLLRAYVGKYFDYLLEHPRILRIFNWEMAEGWQTFSKIVTERDYDDVDQFAPLFDRLQRAGLMRANPNGLVQYTSALFMCHAYLGVVPLYNFLAPGEDLSSPAALKEAREFLIDFIANGLLGTAEGKSSSAAKRASSPKTHRSGRGTAKLAA